MAQSTVLNLLSQTAHPANPGTSVEYIGDQKQAAAYYLANRDLQTVTWNFSSEFEGNCKIQASLVTSPGVSDWFDVYTIDTVNEKNGYHNINGNFVWIRAKVTNWTDGPINLATVSY